MSILIDPPRSPMSQLMDRVLLNVQRQNERQFQEYEAKLRRLIIADKIDRLRQSAGLPLGHAWKFRTVLRVDQATEQKGGD